VRIATFSIAEDHAMLYADRDPFVQHLSLRTAVWGG